MKMLRNKNAPPTADLVQKFIDSAYDKVKLVADNIATVEQIAAALDQGTFDDLVYTYNIDTFAELNALVLDEDLATQAYVDLAVSGLYDHKGGYDAANNVPDLDVAPSGVKKADAYTVSASGLFFTAPVDAGDVLIADVDDAALESDWTIVNRNIDESGFATAAQGAKADTALQPGLVNNISELLNDVGYTDDQTPAEIQTAYNTAVPAATQVEAEAGVAVDIRRWSPLRVAQAAAAQTGVVVFINDDYVALPSQVIYVDTQVKAVQITLPIGSDRNSIWVFDAGHNAAVNNITVIPGGGTDTVDADTSFILDQNESFVRLAYKAATTDWIAGISGVPDLVEMAPHTHTEAQISDFGSYASLTGFSGVNPQTGLTYTFVVGDLSDLVTANNAAASVYSIPDSFGSVGDTINLYNMGAGEVTIAMVGTDTLDTTDNNCSQGKAVTLVKISATVWAVIGGTAAP